MSVTPDNPAVGPALDAFATKPLREQLDFLVKVWTIGSPPLPWSQGLAEAYLRRLTIQGTAKLTAETSRLTKWLIALTGVLVLLAAATIVTTWWFWAHPKNC